MSTMPSLLNFSFNYATVKLNALGVTPVVSYQTQSPPFVTPDIVIAQSPSSGQTISGAVTLTLTGGFKFRNIAPTVFSEPVTLVGSTAFP